jgi:predicted HicB family RNase H-like nuclease
VHPWEEPHIREDVLKSLPLRLSEPLYLKLKYIATHTPYSINSFILERITEEIEEEIARLVG